MDVSRLQLSWLATFLAVVDQGTMTAAARLLHLTQPRVSAHIATLEKEIGAPLFDRGAHGARLTPLGARFLPRARRVFEELSAAADDLAAARGRLEGRLRIGSYPGASAVLVAPLLAEFSARYPAVEVDLVEGDATRLDHAAARGLVDFAVRPAGPPMELDLPSTPLCEEQIVLVSPAGDAAGTDPGRIADATVFVSGDPRTGWADYADRLDTLGVRPRKVTIATMPTTVTAFVRAGLGVGILGAFAARTAACPGTVATKLPGPLWRRAVRVVYAASGASLPRAAFIDLLEDRGEALTDGLASWRPAPPGAGAHRDGTGPTVSPRTRRSRSRPGCR
jgi:DNA-binding transcriptional LysR family regulator